MLIEGENILTDIILKMLAKAEPEILKKPEMEVNIILVAKNNNPK